MKKLVCMLLVCLLSMQVLCAPLAESAVVTYADTDVFLDLSVMSGTVVYSMVYNIMADANNFLDKVIRIKGYYSAWENPDLNVVYTSCVIPDASACCAQGLEFVWGGEHAYPGDYPEFGTTITVTGRLERYLEEGYTYLHLVDAEVLWDDPQV